MCVLDVCACPVCTVNQAHNCSASHPAVFEHVQLELAKCDAASKLQRWMVEPAGVDDQAGQLSTVTIASSVDSSFVMNVGEDDYTELELQLYPKQSGSASENELFRLDASGMLQASITHKGGCMDVCEAGSPHCG